MSREFDQRVTFVNDAIQFDSEEILMSEFGWLIFGQNQGQGSEKRVRFPLDSFL